MDGSHSNALSKDERKLTPQAKLDRANRFSKVADVCETEGDDSLAALCRERAGELALAAASQIACDMKYRAIKLFFCFLGQHDFDHKIPIPGSNCSWRCPRCLREVLAPNAFGV
ncbi:MAG: hypothetical protein JRN68_00965 [Nitrososphaerota archaeon]|nr:hypothetical protein [Nitrososphaerota archaeon]